MNTNEQFGYDKLLTKDEFYLDVIYPNLVKSANIFYYKEEYATARRAGNTIEDVINQTFFYAYKPYARGGKYGAAGETIYDYYVRNFYDVRDHKTQMVPDYLLDEDGKYIYEVGEDGKKHRIQIGEREELIKPCLNIIRQYMNTFTRNVLVDMCKVAENKKSLVSLDTPIGDEEDGRTLMDVISDIEDYDISDSLKDFHYSVQGEVLINKYGNPVSVIDLVLSLESGANIKEVCDEYCLSDYDVLNFFKEKFTLMKDCFSGVSDTSLSKLEKRVRRAKRELTNSIEAVDEFVSEVSMDDLRKFMMS